MDSRITEIHLSRGRLTIFHEGLIAAKLSAHSAEGASLLREVQADPDWRESNDYYQGRMVVRYCPRFDLTGERELHRLDNDQNDPMKAPVKYSREDCEAVARMYEQQCYAWQGNYIAAAYAAWWYIKAKVAQIYGSVTIYE